MVHRVLTLAVLLVSLSAASAAAEVRLPPPNGTLDHQLGGAFPPAAELEIVDRDRTSRPAPGAYNVCYVNVFQTQPGEARWWKRRHPGLLLRRRGARRGFDAVEPDDLGFLDPLAGAADPRAEPGLRTAADSPCAQGGSSIAQKNTTELLASRLDFDFAVAAECPAEHRRCTLCTCRALPSASRTHDASSPP